MFGVVKLREDLKRLRNEVEGNDVRVQVRIDTTRGMINDQSTWIKELSNRQNAALQAQGDLIAKLQRQLRDLASLVDCKITSPTSATEGGEVRKMTETELEARKRHETMFGSGFYFPYLRTSFVSDLHRGKTTKKVNKKKK